MQTVRETVCKHHQVRIYNNVFVKTQTFYAKHFLLLNICFHFVTRTGHGLFLQANFKVCLYLICVPAMCKVNLKQIYMYTLLFQLLWRGWIQSVGGIWTDVGVKDLTTCILVLVQVCSHVEMCMLLLNNLKFWWIGKYLFFFLSPASLLSGIQNP